MKKTRTPAKLGAKYSAEPALSFHNLFLFLCACFFFFNVRHPLPVLIHIELDTALYDLRHILSVLLP